MKTPSLWSVAGVVRHDSIEQIDVSACLFVRQALVLGVRAERGVLLGVVANTPPVFPVTTPGTVIQILSPAIISLSNLSLGVSAACRRWGI